MLRLNIRNRSIVLVNESPITTFMVILIQGFLPGAKKKETDKEAETPKSEARVNGMIATYILLFLNNAPPLLKSIANSTPPSSGAPCVAPF